MQPNSRSGFTLIEILIVLGIVGALVAIAMPNIVRFYDNYQEDSKRLEIERQLARLPYKAYISSQELIFDPTDDQSINKLVKLPEGWQIRSEAPIKYRLDGFCHGGEIEVVSDLKIFTYALNSPQCVPELMKTNDLN
jgi:prepilin-type N-terminal cleavage/methylation domain-containing protein